jgi:phosphogluconate dehydratase
VPTTSADPQVLRPVSDPFSTDGGLKRLHGNLGRAVVKTSAVKPEHRRVRAPAVVVDNQQALNDLYKQGALNRDFVAVVRFQGPQANGMPELHKLTPALGVLQDQGHRVALVTDGRMSGASGKVPAAIHVSPEALLGGPIGLVHNGDMVSLDCDTGELTLEVAPEVLAQRQPQQPDLAASHTGCGRDLFDLFRRGAGVAEKGGSALFGND